MTIWQFRCVLLSIVFFFACGLGFGVKGYPWLELLCMVIVAPLVWFIEEDKRAHIRREDNFFRRGPNFGPRFPTFPPRNK